MFKKIQEGFINQKKEAIGEFIVPEKKSKAKISTPKKDYTEIKESYVEKLTEALASNDTEKTKELKSNFF